MVDLRKPDKVSIEERRQRERLGARIKTLREKRDLSLRQVAAPVGISASNLLVLESGANVPSPKVYKKLIETLKPSPKDRDKLDKLYSSLRGSPPPDVCEIVLQTEGMNDALRILDGITLTPDQLQKLRETLLSFRPPDRGGGERDKHE